MTIQTPTAAAVCENHFTSLKNTASYKLHKNLHCRLHRDCFWIKYCLKKTRLAEAPLLLVKDIETFFKAEEIRKITLSSVRQGTGFAPAGESPRPK